VVLRQSSTDGDPSTNAAAQFEVAGSRIAVTGLLFSALYVVAYLLIHESPSFDATDQVLIDYYSDPANRGNSTLAGLYVIPLAAIFFIWFMAALRDRYHRTVPREHTILSSVQVVAGALLVTAMFTVAGIELAVAWLADLGEAFDADGARALLAAEQAMADIMTLRAAAVFVLVSAARAMRMGLFPRSYTIFSVLIAVTLLFVYQSVPWVSLFFPAWVAGASILILVGRPPVAAEEA
jgi:hypothetical protein